MRIAEVRKVMDAHEFACLMGDALAENVDPWVLESKDQKDIDWFKTVDRIVQYILYNEFDIEVVKEIVE